MPRMAPRIELFDFPYRDPRSGKWVRALHRDTRGNRHRYAEWQLLGPAEVRDVDPNLMLHRFRATRQHFLRFVSAPRNRVPHGQGREGLLAELVRRLLCCNGCIDDFTRQVQRVECFAFPAQNVNPEGARAL